MIYRTGDELIKELKDYIDFLLHEIDVLEKKNSEYKDKVDELEGKLKNARQY